MNGGYAIAPFDSPGDRNPLLLAVARAKNHPTLTGQRTSISEWLSRWPQALTPPTLRIAESGPPCRLTSHSSDEREGWRAADGTTSGGRPSLTGLISLAPHVGSNTATGAVHWSFPFGNATSSPASSSLPDTTSRPTRSGNPTCMSAVTRANPSA